ncbi:MAG: prolyl oligopeptidase family serine peptidase [Candidatus Hydrothermales bacterium]
MKVNYPETKEVLLKEQIFEFIIEDNYRWLENFEDKEVKEWIKKQNEFARKILDFIPQRDIIEREYTEILLKERISAPVVYKDKYFFYKIKKDQNHAILYLSRGEFLPENAEIVLNPNEWSKEGLVSLDFFYPSPDGRYIAYGKSEAGSEASTMYIIDTEKKMILSDKLPNTKWSTVAWLKDNSGFYYTRNEGGEKFLPRVYFHKLGNKYEDDEYIFGRELSDTEIPSVYSSKGGEYIFLEISRGWDKNDLYFKEVKNKEFREIAKGIDAIFEAKVYKDYIYIKTNHNAPNFKLIRIPLENPDLKNSEEVIPEGKGVLKDFTFAGGKIVFTIKENTYYRLFIADLKGKIEYEINTPRKGTIWIREKDYDFPEFYYVFESFFYPLSIHKFNVNNLKDTLIYQRKEDFDVDDYKEELVFYSSKDGTKVPLYILSRKEIKLDGKNPTILTGYGGFGVGISPYFMEELIPFLKRGGVFAIAGLRGGDEYGERWHKEGMREKKQNVFNDFISAAEYLIDKKYTNPEKLAIMGASNGGLLVGAVMTQRPELFKAVYCGVPLLDMIRYHKFGVAHIWTTEYGNPDKEEDFKYLYAYSPYHNIKEDKKYPSVFFKTSEFDGRVHPMHAMKMAAKMQKISKDNLVILYVEEKAGHGAGKPLKKIIKSITDEFIFLMWQLGMLKD